MSQRKPVLQILNTKAGVTISIILFVDNSKNQIISTFNKPNDQPIIVAQISMFTFLDFYLFSHLSLICFLHLQFRKVPGDINLW